MIHVQVTQSGYLEPRSVVERILVQGHAGSGEYGHDLVCAAVSALMINFINSVETLCHIDLAPIVRSGFIDVRVSDDANIQLLARSLLVGLTGISTEHAEWIQVQIDTCK